MNRAVLEGGFQNPPTDAALAFRAVMQAMARPGTIHRITSASPPPVISGAAGAVLLTLCDSETPVYLAPECDSAELRTWIAFHTGAPFASPQRCHFALGSWPGLAPLDGYPVGTPEFPDRSATLIVELDSLQDSGATLRGPGIRDTATLSLPDLASFQRNHALFPLGLDFLLTCGDRIAALPRSIEVS